MSPDLKDVLIATIPSIIPAFMVGIGILLNKNDINRLGSEITALRVEFRADLKEMRAEMNAMRTQFHVDIVGLRSDIATLVGITNDLDKRVSRMEDKS